MATVTTTPREMGEPLRFARVLVFLSEDEDSGGNLLPVNDRIMVEVEWRTDLSTGEVLGESYIGLLKDFPGMTTAEKLAAKASIVVLYNAGKATSVHA